AWLLAAGLGLALLLPARHRFLRLLAVAGVAGLWMTCSGTGISHRDPERAILVDGGGWDGGDLGGRVLLPALLGEGVHHLHALVMTHPDRDHCGGLVDIAAYLPVDEVWTAPGWEPAGCAGRLLSVPGVR